MLLTQRRLATLRAALTYWSEELGPHGPEAMRICFQPSDPEALLVVELDALRRRLAATDLRYAVLNSSGTSLASPELYTPAGLQRLPLDLPPERIVTVLVPQQGAG